MRNYITKLNDRNLQRRKSTGITNYVMYSLIVIILFKIFSTIPKISFGIDLWSLTKILWYSFNFALAAYFIYFSFTMSFGNSSSTRVLKHSKDSESYFMSIVVSLMFLSPVIPIGFIMWHDNSQGGYNYSIWQVILIVLDGFNIFFVAKFLFSKKKAFFNIIKQTKKEKDNNVSAIILVVSILVIFSTIYLLISESEIKELDKLNLFFICLLVFAILVITERIIENYKDDIFTRDLENLEYEIYVKDLSDKQIQLILQNKYMGFLINDWISNKEIEIETQLKKLKNDYSKINEDKKELEKIDQKKYPLEYKGRLENIKVEEVEVLKKQRDFYENNLKEIIEIKNKDQSINDIELERLDKLREKLNEEIRTLKELQN